jgi:hypothetical protein
MVFLRVVVPVVEETHKVDLNRSKPVGKEVVAQGSRDHLGRMVRRIQVAVVVVVVVKVIITDPVAPVVPGS